MSPIRVRRWDPARVIEGVSMALEAIRVNKVRATLTILGVAIGVTVVIAMAAVINGINRSVAEMLERAGPRTFAVARFFEGGIVIHDGSEERDPYLRYPKVTVKEARLIAQLPVASRVGWREQVDGSASAGSLNARSVRVIGTTPNLLEVEGGTLISGREFSQVEFAAGAATTTINLKLAELLFPNVDPIGKRIKLLGTPVTVVGVYSEPSNLLSSLESQPTALVPHPLFAKMAEAEHDLMILVRPVDSVAVERAQDQVIAALRQARGLRPAEETNFAVVTQDKLLATYRQVTSGFYLVMLALSSVGLMVGGVGVVAIMMISVTERTREIGVRKALGATRREVLFQFLVEAATLTLLGGAIGLVLGAGIAWVFASITHLPATVPLWSVATALTASVITGIFFGLYPARKAARLDPVEALRWE